MLKSILELKEVKLLDKKEQQQIQGGGGFCRQSCLDPQATFPYPCICVW